MSDSILEGLKTVIADCPDLAGEAEEVFTDYIREEEPCYGVFPAGEKKLSADWAGNERWQYDFTIQMVGFAFQERERMHNEIAAERFSRWISESGAKKLALGNGELLESLWVGQGHLLYPAQDGNTFVYEMAGRLIYRRKKTDVTPRQGWFFAFDPAEEKIWLECTAGIEQIEEKPTENTWFFDLEGRKKGMEAAAGSVVFSGWLCPEDPFQQKVLQQGTEQAVRWVCCSEGEIAAGLPAVGGLCSLQLQREFVSGEKGGPCIRIQMHPLTKEKGWFWRDAQGYGAFLPEKPDIREEIV